MSIVTTHPDGTQVHGLLNDGVIVVQAQSNCIHRGIEGPCICLVSLWEHFLQDVIAAPELLRKFDLLVLNRQVFLWRFDGSSTASPGEKCTWRSLVLLLTSGNGGGGGSVVCSPLETFFNLKFKSFHWANHSIKIGPNSGTNAQLVFHFDSEKLSSRSEHKLCNLAVWRKLYGYLATMI